MKLSTMLVRSTILSTLAGCRLPGSPSRDDFFGDPARRCKREPTGPALTMGPRSKVR